jgi:DNA-binding response OmpR family regulator
MSKTILVVDDSRDTVKIMQTILAANGYTVRVAHNGPEALAQVGAETPDLIILDVMMPQMSGMEVLSRIKEATETANIPVIMCTAKTQDSDVLDGYRLGADYYITKPFTAHQLMYGVGLLLGGDGRPPS